MDDDLTFGASVWAVSDPVLPPSHDKTVTIPPPPPTSLDDSLDDFDDFGPSVQTTGSVEHDDFGDFGEFDDAQGEISQDFGHDALVDEGPQPGPSHQNVDILRLDPIPSREDLLKQVNDILGPIWGDFDISQDTSQEEIRQVEGIGQILDTSESRDYYNTLIQIPQLKPPNWKRSRIRRQHLISLGIPVNLDELLPNANGKQLPPLQITTRPMSAPPVHKNEQHLSAPEPPQAGPVPSPFGPKPELDEQKISELLALNPEAQTLLSVATLESRLADIRVQTAQTSALLKHLLQTREALQQDSESYNKVIGELVGEAQKIKTSKGRPAGRRGGGG